MTGFDQSSNPGLRLAAGSRYRQGPTWGHPHPTHRATARSLAQSCAGYATSEILHKRTFEVTADEITILDEFDRVPASAELRLPLAPGLEPVLEGTVARIDLGRGSLRIELPRSAVWTAERAAAYPEFGKQVERTVLVGRARELASASWTITLDAS